MSTLLHRIAAMMASLALALPAAAATFSVDYTDLWYNPAEPGWGVNLIQQNRVIFATLFVYGSDNTPRWYVASDLEGTSATSFSGTLYRTSGPYFGAAWTSSPPPVVAGSMTLTFTSDTTATLAYTADGVTVTKSVQRQSWRAENLSGNYVGGISATASSCNPADLNGGILVIGFPPDGNTRGVLVTHNPSGAVGIIINFVAPQSGSRSQCVLNGVYSQAGRWGSVAGTWACTIAGASFNQGSFSLTQIDAGLNGFTARFIASDQSCQYAGSFGVVRDTP